MMKRTIVYLVVALLFFGCKKENAGDCFKSNGKLVTEERSIGQFEIVKVYDKIDLNISQGSEFKVEVNAGEHLLSNISTKISDGILTIRNNNKCNFVRGYKKRVTVNITVPAIAKVDNEGVGTVRFLNTFVQDTIIIRAENSGDIYVKGTFNQISTSSHGNGDIYVEGNANRMYVYMFGTNFLNAQGLTISNYLFVETISIGDCHVNLPANGTFAYNIWRSGNIYYSGDAAVITNYSDGTAKGRLIRE
ncbi:MAG: GIN domain-containing protein [Bacteroidia bacterium]